MPKAILDPLKNYSVAITSVTAMVTNGGSTGQFRNDFNVLPPGAIRNHIYALSEAPKWKRNLWNFRFGHEAFDENHKGHNFANALISGLEYNLKDYGKVLDFLHGFMEVKGKVLPATIEKTQIYAELENGEIIKGEDEIDVPRRHDPNLKIKKVFLKPKAKAFSKSLEAVEKADLITIGPGDLYSSSVPCLLMEGMKESFKKSKAKKVLIVNAMTKLGETNDFSVADFASEVEKYMGCLLDYVIYNSEIPDKKRIDEYKKEESSVIELVKVDPSTDSMRSPQANSGQAGKKFIGTEILTKEGVIIYDPGKLVKTIISLL